MKDAAGILDVLSCASRSGLCRRVDVAADRYSSPQVGETRAKGTGTFPTPRFSFTRTPVAESFTSTSEALEKMLLHITAQSSGAASRWPPSRQQITRESNSLFLHFDEFRSYIRPQSTCECLRLQCTLRGGSGSVRIAQEQFSSTGDLKQMVYFAGFMKSVHI